MAPLTCIIKDHTHDARDDFVMLSTSAGSQKILWVELKKGYTIGQFTSRVRILSPRRTRGQFGHIAHGLAASELCVCGDKRGSYSGSEINVGATVPKLAPTYYFGISWRLKRNQRSPISSINNLVVVANPPRERLGK